MVRTEVGVRRKFLHLFLGAAFMLSLLVDDRLRWAFLVLLCFGLALSLYQEKRPIKSLTWVLDRYDKSGDVVPGQGPITFFLGSLLAWSLFPEALCSTPRLL